MESIIVAIVTGVFSVIGVVITNIASSKKMANQLEIHQAVTSEKIDNLSKRVEKHNNFAERLPVMEEQIKVINHRIDDLERKVE